MGGTKVSSCEQTTRLFTFDKVLFAVFHSQEKFCRNFLFLQEKQQGE